MKFLFRDKNFNLTITLNNKTAIEIDMSDSPPKTTTSEQNAFDLAPAVKRKRNFEGKKVIYDQCSDIDVKRRLLEHIDFLNVRLSYLEDQTIPLFRKHYPSSSFMEIKQEIEKDQAQQDCLLDDSIAKKNKTNDFECKKLKEDAKVPVKKHSLDAGFDLFAYTESIIKSSDADDKECLNPVEIIEPGQTKWIKTNIQVSIPQGYVGIVKGRSSMPQVIVNAGVVDSGYLGEIKICISYPISDAKEQEDFVISHRQKIAQLILVKIHKTESAKLVEEFTNSNSERGEKGFGSSGKY